MPSPLLSCWTLEPEVVYLNHGSFGACPRAVLEVQQDLRDRLERQPCRFFVRELEPLLDAARARVAEFVRCSPDDLVPVVNATTGVNAVVRSLRLEPGDEVLVTDHAYGACANAVRHVAERTGARVVTARVPFPVAGDEEVVQSVVACVGARTRLALIDHVTSPTGLIFPIERIVSVLDSRGIDVLVDGAHAPGMVDLNLEEIGAAYYTANLHKWTCAPKGAAFLHVRRDRQEGIVPAVVSHGLVARREGRPRLHDGFDWPGTADPTAFLSVPAALDLVASLVEGGWDEVRRRNHALVGRGRQVLGELLGEPAPCPEVMVGSMAAVALPDGPPRRPDSWCMDMIELQDRLIDRHGVEVLIQPWPRPESRLLRISAQLYNSEADYARLGEALMQELATERPPR